MSEVPSRILLDTHALLWMASGSLSSSAADAVRTAGLTQGVLVSPASFWELGLLARPRIGPPRIRLDPDPERFIDDLLSNPAIAETPLTASIAFASTSLPGSFHQDPADRFLVATARALGIPLLTRDRAILAYAEQGHVRAIAC